MSSEKRRPQAATQAAVDRYWWAFGAVAVLFAVIVLRRLGDVSLGYPDADRILMDGVFFRDLLVDLPLTDPYGYLKHYFAQYPALSIGYRPPFFPFVEGLFNAVFGVNIWSSRLALLLFGLVGLTALFATVRRAFGAPAALASVALLATTPFVMRLSWYTMGEIPVVSMGLVTLYFYHRYVTEQTTRDLWFAAIAAVLAVWTKQTAIFLLVWMLLHQLTTGRLLGQLRQLRVWAVIGFVIVSLIPLVLITLILGEQNLKQSVGTVPVIAGEQLSVLEAIWANIAQRLRPEVLLLRIEQLYQVHLTLPALILALVGFIWAIWKRDGRVWFWVTFILAVYLVFTYIRGSNHRYPIFWIPAFLVLASLPLAYLPQGGKWYRGLFGGLIAAVVAWQLYAVYQINPKHATGYDQAAQFVLDNSQSPTVFFDGYNNGYFTYFMRALDPQRSMYVLRGDKLLSSSSISSKNMLELHAENEADILEMLDRHGFHYVVVEDENTIDVPIHGLLRELLKEEERFQLVERIPVDTGTPTTREPLEGVSLLIYEVLDRSEPQDGILELHLPVVGQTLRVPLRGLTDREAGAPEPGR